MIEIQVILPNGTKRRGKIDPSASLEKNKTDIVNALGLGPPEEYDLAVSPRIKTQSLQNYRPRPGDTFILIEIDRLQGSSFELVD